MQSTDRNPVTPRQRQVDLFTFRLRQMALILVLICLTPVVLAQTLSQTELQKLLASDAPSNNRFGYSVSLSGDRALVGADRDDHAGSNSGSAYVFEKDAVGTWVQVAKLTASDSAAGDRFGIAAALFGDRALVGATGNDDAGESSGSAYIYERDGTGTWVQLAKLTTLNAAAYDQFGWSVSLSDDRALISTIDGGNDDAGIDSSSAFVFERNETGIWEQVTKLAAIDDTARAFDRFGYSVALSGDRALVGAIDHRSGAVYVFERDEAGTWVQEAKLTDTNSARPDRFGESVSLSGNRALIGAIFNSDAGRFAGAAYVFERDDSGMWAEVTKLTASDSDEFDSFGRSVALSGNRALIGAYRDDDAGTNSGSAYVFERDDTGIWEEVAKLTASDATIVGQFGGAVALLNDRALIGATGGSGSAYVFDVAALGDVDGDTVTDAEDNCPVDANPLQENFDLDLLGDACDLDDDNDGVDDNLDAFPVDANRAVLCEPGFFGAFSCEPAPAGTYVASAGELSATNCSVGSFSALEAATECELAAIGFYVDTDGAADSTACPVGTTTESSGAASLQACFPQIISPASVSSVENQATAIDVQITDESEVSGLAYSLTGGDDATLFAINFTTGVITFNSLPDFEAPSDSDGDNVYNVQVSVSDSNGLTAVQDITITVTAEVENTAPAITSPAAISVPENQTVALDVQSTDDNDSEGDGLSYALSGGTDAALFNINASTGMITFITVPNFETPSDSDGDNVYNLQVSVSDSNGSSAIQNIDLTVTEVIEGGLPPLIIDSVDSSVYGFGFEGTNGNRESVELEFVAATDTDLLLSVSGYDIDTAEEVRVLVNDTPIGFLSRTPNNARGPTQLAIAQNLLNGNADTVVTPLRITRNLLVEGKTGNTIRFEQTNPGWKWGVTDLLLSENTSTGELPPLILESEDTTKYGFRFEGVNSHREALERVFDASGSDLSLTVVGYDIDVREEVSVLVNGIEIGFLSRTPNNGTQISRLTIPQRLLDSAGNTLRFENNNPGWVWGVTNLLISKSGGSGEFPPLILDSIDSTKFGFRYNGVNSHREALERRFDASDTVDLLLTVNGFDIDVAKEVRVLVNGAEIGFLSRTPNNANDITRLAIAQSLLSSEGNTLRFEQLNPGWKWGVTDLLLTVSAGEL